MCISGRVYYRMLLFSNCCCAVIITEICNKAFVKFLSYCIVFLVISNKKWLKTVGSFFSEQRKSNGLLRRWRRNKKNDTRGVCSIQSLERLIWFIIFYYIVKQLTLTFQGHMLFFLMEFNKLFQIIWYFGYVNCCWTIATGINMHLIIGLKRNKTHCFPWCQSHCVFYTVQLKKIKQFM